MSNYTKTAIDLALEAGESVISVSSGSMKPLIAEGDKVVIQPCLATDLQIGDIVLLRNETNLLLHRYLGTLSRQGKQYVLCKGDSYWHPDTLKPAKWIVGKAVRLKNRTNKSLVPAFYTRTIYFFYKLLINFYPGAIKNFELTKQQKNIFFSLSDEVICLQFCGSGWQKEEKELCLSLRNFLSPPRDAATTVKLKITEKCEFAPGNRIIAGQAEIATESMQVRIPLTRSRVEASIIIRNPAQTVAALRAFVRFKAVTDVLTAGGVCLHASSVKTKNGQVYVFAGPSGRGKTTSAASFPPATKLDDDLVLLSIANNTVKRLPALPLHLEDDANIAALATLPVQAIFLPEAASEFALKKISGSQALVSCLHLPPIIQSREKTEKIMHSVVKMLELLPLYSLHWQKEQDLPALLEKNLANLSSSK